MASIHRRTGSPFWIAAFDVPLPDGTFRRMKVSTKRQSRTEAMKEALRIEEAERLKAGLVDDAKGQKAYEILREAADSLARGDLSEAKGREFLAKLTEAATGTPLKFYTVRSWCADWLNAKSAVTKASTTERYRSSVASFLTHIGPKADGRLEAVTKDEIRAFRDSLRKGGRSAKTCNCRLKDVISVFRAAVREGLLLASPAAGVEILPEDDSVEREPFTLEEVAALVKSAPDDDWKGVILFGAYTGARLGDCANMVWKSVDLKSGVVSFVPAKTSRKKKRLEVPLHARLKAFLKDHRKTSTGDGPIFPSLHGKTSSGNTGLSVAFAAIMDAARIDRPTGRVSERNKGGKVIRRSIRTKSFHSLRHTLTSNLANLDVPEEIRRKIVGHDTADMHAKYTHTETATLARAIERLPSL